MNNPVIERMPVFTAIEEGPVPQPFSLAATARSRWAKRAKVEYDLMREILDSDVEIFYLLPEFPLLDRTAKPALVMYHRAGALYDMNTANRE